MQNKSFNTQFKADEDGLKEGEFIAYPSTFTRTPDSYGDVVASHAFDDTIRDWKASGKTLPVMYMHRMDDPSYNIGGVEDMGSDEHGWWIKAQLDMDNPVAKQVYKLVKAGRLSQLSFAFDILDSAPVKLDDGTKARELRKLKVYEASIVPVGANQDTSIVDMKAETVQTKDGKTLSNSTSAFLTNILTQIQNLGTQVSTFLDQNKSDSDLDTSSDGEQTKDKEPTRVKSEESHEALALATQIATTINKEN